MSVKFLILLIISNWTTKTCLLLGLEESIVSVNLQVFFTLVRYNKNYTILASEELEEPTFVALLGH